MTSRRLFISSLFTLTAAVPLLCSANNCCPSEKAAQNEEKPASASKLTATGATVVESNDKMTKLAIKCAKCGFKAELEIDTPTADKPFSLEWVCPKCKHTQQITVAVAKAD